MGRKGYNREGRENSNMCTAIRLVDKECYFGRNLDVPFSYGEGIVLIPRKAPLSFRHEEEIREHPAILGMGLVQQGYPLLFDAMNEKGLSIAGLNFPGNAVYLPLAKDKRNLASFEWMNNALSRFQSVSEVKEFLKGCNFVDESFSKDLPSAPLHYLVSDSKESLVVEPTREGLKLYDNPYDVLTNNPPFPFHRENLKLYASLSPKEREQGFSKDTPLPPFAAGFGTLGLPGDLSSPSRFVRTYYYLKTSLPKKTEEERVLSFLRILSQVSFPEGSVQNKDGSREKTLYSSCMNLSRGTYSYRTLESDDIRQVAFDDFDLEQEKVLFLSLERKPLVHRMRPAKHG